MIEGKQVRRRTPLTEAGSTTHGLPPEIAATAVRRLGFLGLIIALMGPCSYLIESATQPQRVAHDGGLHFQLWVAVLLAAAGLSMFVLAWKRLARPELLLDAGLVFEVVVAFAISLSENATAWPADQEIRGISWNCLWISMYLVAIPGTYGKSVLASISAACMAPFGLLVACVVNDHAIPDARQLTVLLLPPFAAAAWAIPVARHLNRLSVQVSKARAMGSYELIELIGTGGMGEVWRARHRMLARFSAVKLIRPSLIGYHDAADVDNLLHRFAREARATAALTSPHTVSLFDYGTSEDGSFYYAMELLDGMDLESLVQQFGPLPAGRVMRILQQACKSLAEAHDHGLVHRDVKPHNIFVCRLGTEYDFVKLLDFGLVKVSEPSMHTQLTPAGATTGTPAYMAPEVAIGSPHIDGRTDLYSLACVGYWLLTGRLVFESVNSTGMVVAHVQTKPTPPSRRTELAIPASLEAVILRCLEKNPADRPATARELFDLLSACEGVPAWTDEDAERWWRAHLPRKTTAPAAEAAGVGLETI